MNMSIGESRRLHVSISALLNYCLICLPLFFVAYLPIVDLPQHLEQIYLFRDVLQSGNPAYFIKWNTPYSLVYFIAAPLCHVLPPLVLAKAIIAIIFLCWIVAVYFIIYLRNRPLWIGPLTTLFVFNGVFYWGLLQFTLGIPILLGFFLLLEYFVSCNLPSWKKVIFLVMASIILYLTHILVLLAAVAWTIFAILVNSVNYRKMLPLILGLVPIIIAVVLWYPSLHASGFDSPTRYVDSPVRRLSFSFLVDAVFGGWNGYFELVYFCFILFILLLGFRDVAVNRKQVDFGLIKLAGFFALLLLFLPNLHSNSIMFARRWAPVMFMCLLLALPNFFSTHGRIKYICSWALAMIFVVTTSLYWMTFERTELQNFNASIEQLPQNASLLTLNFDGADELFKPKFIHAGTYAALLRGARTNFSFTEFGTGLVQKKSLKHQPWTKGLEWEPTWVRKRDFSYFDFVLFNGLAGEHQLAQEKFPIKPLSQTKGWRLYKVIHE